MTRGAPTSSAAEAMTGKADASCGTAKAGTPHLRIPAFSPAIVATSFPSTFMWSRPTRVMPQTRGAQWLVQSHLPPSPVSSTAQSTPAAVKHTKASAESFSNGVACPSASTAGRTRRIAVTTRSLLTSSPSIRMRSRHECKCGDVKSPTREPLARSAASQSADVVPLPLVPAMCTHFNRSSGRSSACMSMSKRAQFSAKFL
mmetsp:Transcript_87526/g.245844  ORF Transcript_87526/g.245844 Transcript_87526/m.245844 type:complete len:201 (+) Transcript_87526:785-1387(+)